MALITKFKMGSVNNLSDARFAAGFEADFIGFCFDPESSLYLDADKAKEIKGWIEGPEFVGEFGNQSAEEINRIAELLKLDYVQINPEDTDADLKDIHTKVIRMYTIEDMKALDRLNDSLAENKDSSEFSIICISDEKLNEKLLNEADSFSIKLKKLCNAYPLILDLTFTRDNLLKLVNTYKPFGVNISGGEELKPGYRDFDELIDMVELLEID